MGRKVIDNLEKIVSNAKMNLGQRKKEGRPDSQSCCKIKKRIRKNTKWNG